MIVKYLAPALVIAVAANLAVAGDFYEQQRKKRYFEEEAAWQESALAIPAYSSQFVWAALDAPIEVRSQLFIDTRSIQLAEDGVVRVTLRQLSRNNVENISREGVHCNERSTRSYAFADISGQRWIEATRSVWRKVTMTDYLKRTLVNAVCPDSIAPRSEAELIQHLQKSPSKTSPK